MRKGNCPECNAGPMKIEVWNTIYGTGARATWLKCTECQHQFPVPKQAAKKKLKPEHREAIAICREFNAWRRGAESAAKAEPGGSGSID